MKAHIIITVVGMILGSLFLPIFTQWYEQQTGIFPVIFMAITIALATANVMYIMIKVMEGKH